MESLALQIPATPPWLFRYPDTGQRKSSDESGQSQLENFIILDTKKSICNSWEEAKNINITGVCKNLIPALMDDLKDSRFQEETTGGNDKATVHRVAGSQTQLSD